MRAGGCSWRIGWEVASTETIAGVVMPQAGGGGGASGTSHPRQDSKIFCGGLSWGTTAEKLEAYFSNFGQVCCPRALSQAPQ